MPVKAPAFETCLFEDFRISDGLVLSDYFEDGYSHRVA